MTIAENFAVIQERIDRAARAAGRDPREIRLVGVTKTHPPELVRAAFDAGLRDVGENRVQEAEAKIATLESLRGSLTWHLIGHLQTNKAKKAAALFDVTHSVDSLRIAEALSRHRAPEQPLPVLLQVNVSGETSKEGFDLARWQERPEALQAFLRDVEQVLALPGLRVRGLMTVAPWSDDPEQARPVFRATRALRDELARRFPAAEWSDLSMGMTDDFAVAIGEGATIVRIGRAIFGSRA